MAKSTSAYYDSARCPPKLSKREESEFRAITLTADYSHKNLEIIREVVDEFRRRGCPSPRFVLTI